MSEEIEMVLVPVRPTMEMRIAGCSVILPYPFAPSHAAEVYKAMIAASQQGSIPEQFYKYTFGEADGPFPCKACRRDCWSVYTEERMDTTLVLQGAGKALCGSCAPENWVPGGESFLAMMPDSPSIPTQVEQEEARNWTEDYSHENGGYYCVCMTCQKVFMGHKRRNVCKVCSKPANRDSGNTSNGDVRIPIPEKEATYTIFSTGEFIQHLPESDNGVVVDREDLRTILGMAEYAPLGMGNDVGNRLEALLQRGE